VPLKAQADLLVRDRWIIDGFGCLASAWERFAVADTSRSGSSTARAELTP
jgi:hypothetical protein